MDLNEIIAEILRAYLFPILLIAFGVFLFVIGVASRDESQPDRKDGDAPIRIGPLTIPAPYLPRSLRFAFMIGGVVLIVIGVAYIGFGGYKRTQPMTVSPSLISLSYMVDGWDPRMVDLRTASSNGIPVRANQALQLLDLWVWVPQQAPEYIVQAEVYANDEFIGATASRPLLAGAVQLGDVTAKSFYHGVHSAAWQVQEDWTDMVIVLVTYRGDKVMGTTRTTIHLDPNGTAWLLDPPNLGYASIVYSINDGPPIVLDLREAGQVGIEIEPGDTLTLLEIWYGSNAYGEEGELVYALGFLSPDGENQVLDTGRSTSKHLIEPRIHNFPSSSLSWSQIPDDARFLIVQLFRGIEDSMFMDELKLPFNPQGNPGLVRRSEVVLWPFGQVEYADFETPVDLDEWTGSVTSTVAQSSDQAFTGDHALAITMVGNPPGEDYVQTRWEHPFQGEVIVGQVYWPRQEGVSLVWAQACTWECVPIPLDLDQWSTFVIDLSEMTFQGKPLNTIEFPGIWIQTQVEGADEANPYTFYVDGIQLYPTHKP